VSYVEVEYRMSERQACRLVGLARSTNRYRTRKTERDAALRTRLKELAAKRMRFGYRRLTAMLMREGMAVNHKRVYRLYREEGLAMRIRARRRIRWSGVARDPAASRPNERWSMDFLHMRECATFSDCPRSSFSTPGVTLLGPD
jgi:putative transposase